MAMSSVHDRDHDHIATCVSPASHQLGGSTISFVGCKTFSECDLSAACFAIIDRVMLEGHCIGLASDDVGSDTNKRVQAIRSDVLVNAGTCVSGRLAWAATSACKSVYTLSY